MNAITINTVQGIGDIFWCYQKLAPYCSALNLNVLYVRDGIIQRRARAFCAMLPKVRDITYQQVAAPIYNRIASTRYTLADAMRRRGAADYACNKPLEDGIALEDIDPGADVQSFVDLGLPADVVQEDYLCVFVAGSTSAKVWKPAIWVDAVRQMAQWLQTRRIVFIGAEWDKPVADIVYRALASEYQCATHVGTLGLADSVDVIRRARFFLGYQSGLNVIAENYNVCQLMIYFEHLRAMMPTWAKPESIGTQYFAMTFNDDIAATIARLPVREHL